MSSPSKALSSWEKSLNDIIDKTNRNLSSMKSSTGPIYGNGHSSYSSADKELKHFTRDFSDVRKKLSLERSSDSLPRAWEEKESNSRQPNRASTDGADIHSKRGNRASLPSDVRKAVMKVKDELQLEIDSRTSSLDQKVGALRSQLSDVIRDYGDLFKKVRVTANAADVLKEDVERLRKGGDGNEKSLRETVDIIAEGYRKSTRVVEEVKRQLQLHEDKHTAIEGLNLSSKLAELNRQSSEFRSLMEDSLAPLISRTQRLEKWQVDCEKDVENRSQLLGQRVEAQAQAIEKLRAEALSPFAIKKLIEEVISERCSRLENEVMKRALASAEAIERRIADRLAHQQNMMEKNMEMQKGEIYERVADLSRSVIDLQKKQAQDVTSRAADIDQIMDKLTVQRQELQRKQQQLETSLTNLEASTQEEREIGQKAERSFQQLESKVNSLSVALEGKGADWDKVRATLRELEKQHEELMEERVTLRSAIKERAESTDSGFLREMTLFRASTKEEIDRLSRTISALKEATLEQLQSYEDKNKREQEKSTRETGTALMELKTVLDRTSAEVNGLKARAEAAESSKELELHALRRKLTAAMEEWKKAESKRQHAVAAHEELKEKLTGETQRLLERFREKEKDVEEERKVLTSQLREKEMSLSALETKMSFSTSRLAQEEAVTLQLQSKIKELRDQLTQSKRSLEASAEEGRCQLATAEKKLQEKTNEVLRLTMALEEQEKIVKGLREKEASFQERERELCHSKDKELALLREEAADLVEEMERSLEAQQRKLEGDRRKKEEEVYRLEQLVQSLQKELLEEKKKDKNDEISTSLPSSSSLPASLPSIAARALEAEQLMQSEWKELREREVKKDEELKEKQEKVQALEEAIAKLTEDLKRMRDKSTTDREQSIGRGPNEEVQYQAQIEALQREREVEREKGEKREKHLGEQLRRYSASLLQVENKLRQLEASAGLLLSTEEEESCNSLEEELGDEEKHKLSPLLQRLDSLQKAISEQKARQDEQLTAFSSQLGQFRDSGRTLTPGQEGLTTVNPEALRKELETLLSAKERLEQERDTLSFALQRLNEERDSLALSKEHLERTLAVKDTTPAGLRRAGATQLAERLKLLQKTMGSLSTVRLPSDTGHLETPIAVSRFESLGSQAQKIFSLLSRTVGLLSDLEKVEEISSKAAEALRESESRAKMKHSEAEQRLASARTELENAEEARKSLIAQYRNMEAELEERCSSLKDEVAAVQERHNKGTEEEVSLAKYVQEVHRQLDEARIAHLTVSQQLSAIPLLSAIAQERARALSEMEQRVKDSDERVKAADMSAVEALIGVHGIVEPALASDPGKESLTSTVSRKIIEDLKLQLQAVPLLTMKLAELETELRENTREDASNPDRKSNLAMQSQELHVPMAEKLVTSIQTNIDKELGNQEKDEAAIRIQSLIRKKSVEKQYQSLSRVSEDEKERERIAVTKVQSLVRQRSAEKLVEALRKQKNEEEVEGQREAATKIQSLTRRRSAEKQLQKLRQEKEAEEQEVERREAATKIQSMVRRRSAEKLVDGLRNGRLEEEAEEWREAATKIQTFTRRRSAEKQLQKLRHEKEVEDREVERQEAATRIQSVVRRRSAEELVDGLRNKRKEEEADMKREAATKIQSLTRRRSAERHVQKLRKLKEAEDREVERQEAATRVQSLVRRRSAERLVDGLRKEKEKIEERREAATKIQSLTRRRSAERLVQKLREEKEAEERTERQEAVTKIQSLVRRRSAENLVARLRREKMEEEAEVRREAVTKIQSLMRRKSAEKRVERMQRAREEEKVELEAAAAIKIQSLVRQKLAAEVAAGLRKGKKDQEESLQQVEAATRIQSLTRRRSAERLLKKLQDEAQAKEEDDRRKAAAKIQRLVRRSSARNKELEKLQPGQEDQKTNTERRQAVTKIQRLARRRAARKLRRSLLEEREAEEKKEQREAATKIQCLVRRRSAEMLLAELQKKRQESFFKGQNEAATKIQSVVRRSSAKKLMKRLQAQRRAEVKAEEQDEAATRIQCLARQRSAKKTLRTLCKENEGQRLETERLAATRIQSMARRKSAKKLLAKLQRERIEVKEGEARTQAATKIQRLARQRSAQKLLGKLQMEKAEQSKAASRIQLLVRQNVAEKQKEAAIKIQSLARRRSAQNLRDKLQRDKEEIGKEEATEPTKEIQHLRLQISGDEPQTLSSGRDDTDLSISTVQPTPVVAAGGEGQHELPEQTGEASEHALLTSGGRQTLFQLDLDNVKRSSMLESWDDLTEDEEAVAKPSENFRQNSHHLKGEDSSPIAATDGAAGSPSPKGSLMERLAAARLKAAQQAMTAAEQNDEVSPLPTDTRHPSEDSADDLQIPALGSTFDGSRGEEDEKEKSASQEDQKAPDSGLLSPMRLTETSNAEDTPMESVEELEEEVLEESVEELEESVEGMDEELLDKGEEHKSQEYEDEEFDSYEDEGK